MPYDALSLGLFSVTFDSYLAPIAGLAAQSRNQRSSRRARHLQSVDLDDTVSGAD